MTVVLDTLTSLPSSELANEPGRCFRRLPRLLSMRNAENLSLLDRVIASIVESLSAMHLDGLPFKEILPVWYLAQGTISL